MKLNKTTPNGITIAVIGGGASGVMMVIHLVNNYIKRKPGKHLKIYLVEKEQKVGTGVAYTTDKDFHILNMRTGTMSIYPETPRHFIKWLEKNKETVGLTQEEITYNSFIPRKIFGKYLQTSLNNAIKKARKYGIDVEIIVDEVIDCHESDAGIKLVFKKQSLKVDFAVLTIGNLLSTNYPHFFGLPNYHPSPWEITEKKLKNSDSSIGILGSSLTAIDAAFSCSKITEGKLYFIARNGLLPKVQGERKPHKLKYITKSMLRKMTKNYTKKLRLTDIASLFKREIEYGLQTPVDWEKVLKLHKDAEEVLKEDIVKAKNNQTHWHTILDKTSALVPIIWHHLDENDKEIFMDKYSALWRIYRHCIPLQNAEKIVDLLDNDKIKIIKNLQKIDYDPATKTFTIYYLHADKMNVLTVPYLVDATGTGFQIKKSHLPLIQNMLKRKSIVEHPFGGVTVNFETSKIINKKGRESQKMFFIGPLTKGVHFYTNAIEMNVVHTKRVANLIMQAIT